MAPRAPARLRARNGRRTWQDFCEARNGVRNGAQPRALIAQVAELVELPSADECRGSAGTYSIPCEPGDSRRMLADKLREIEAADVDVLVTINPGCYRELERGVRRARLPARVVHIAELLAAVPWPARSQACRGAPHIPAPYGSWRPTTSVLGTGSVYCALLEQQRQRPSAALLQRSRSRVLACGCVSHAPRSAAAPGVLRRRTRRLSGRPALAGGARG